MEHAMLHEKLNKTLNLDQRSSRILIVGLGFTGLSVARFLYGLDYKFAIVDTRINPPMNHQLLGEMPDIAVFTGGFDEAAFEISSHIMVSPGVSLNEPVIKEALKKGSILISDIDLFASVVSEPIVAITGSNGKSTVTTMLGAMAKAEGRKVAIGGNLGTPALDLLKEEPELFVLELSSFQLERTMTLEATAATVLNVTEDHLDRYPDVIEYAAAKQKIFNGDGIMVLNSDDPFVIGMIEPDRETLTFGIDNAADFYLSNDHGVDYLAENGHKLMFCKELQIFGSHNIANALAAWALGRAIGLSDKAMYEALKAYRGMDHRMQSVAEIDGVVWINDSKATNVGACTAALKGLNKKIILIAGGDAKGADLRSLTAIMETKVKTVIVMGKDADLIRQVVPKKVLIRSANSIEDAVAIARDLAQSGDCVLLSPACASLDQYSSYEERGRLFSEAVKGVVA